mmetsp:Transcript_21505/g.54159  ORF Transcript_21505/g.54159 Transcript_21505/m.54159 type:complete len:208 (+) Transcript_21505:672-1295(+)
MESKKEECPDEIGSSLLPAPAFPRGSLLLVPIVAPDAAAGVLASLVGIPTPAAAIGSPRGSTLFIMRGSCCMLRRGSALSFERAAAPAPAPPGGRGSCCALKPPFAPPFAAGTCCSRSPAPATMGARSKFSFKTSSTLAHFRFSSASTAIRRSVTRSTSLRSSRYCTFKSSRSIKESCSLQLSSSISILMQLSSNPRRCFVTSSMAP